MDLSWDKQQVATTTAHMLERLRSVKQICSETNISGSLNTSLMDSQAQHDGANRNVEISS